MSVVSEGFPPKKFRPPDEEGASRSKTTQGLTANQDIVLRVSDNGRGLSQVSGGQGYGLRNMRTRAEALGGTLHIGPAEDGGTVVEWRVPAKRSNS